MLLTHLNETITRRAKSTEELQKLLDASDSTGIVAVSADTVQLVEHDNLLQNIITAGKLPFKFAKNSQEQPAILKVIVPTLRTLAGMEELELFKLIINPLTKPKQFEPATVVGSKLETLVGMPKVYGKLEIRNASVLKSLTGLTQPPTTLDLSECPMLESLAGAEGVKKVILSGMPKLSLKDFPKSCSELNINHFHIERGLPWIIKIPHHCRILFDSYTFDGVPKEILTKIFDYRQLGNSSTVAMLEIQADLIDAGVADELAEI